MDGQNRPYYQPRPQPQPNGYYYKPNYGGDNPLQKKPKRDKKRVSPVVILMIIFLITSILLTIAIIYNENVHINNLLQAKTINDENIAKYEALQKEYNDYKQKAQEAVESFEKYMALMKPYEGLAEAEAQQKAEQLNAENAATAAVNSVWQADSNALAPGATREAYNNAVGIVSNLPESEFKNRLLGFLQSTDAALSSQEETARAAAEEEARGYDTGITYDQIARTPDEYKGKKEKIPW